VNYIPNFKHFYSNSLLSAAYYGRPEWKEKLTQREGKDVSHWLIAYEWSEKEEGNGWHVLVYPSDRTGCFIDRDPVFMNERPVPFEKAQELAASFRIA
jgi:hypothetical protein